MDNITSRQKKKLSNTAMIVLVYVISVLLGIILAPYLSKIYIFLFKPKPNLSLLAFDDSRSLVDGFLIGYTFFLSLLVAFIEKKKHRFWTWFIGIIFFLLIFLGEWNYFGFVILLSLIGYLLGVLILWLKTKIKQNN